MKRIFIILFTLVLSSVNVFSQKIYITDNNVTHKVYIETEQQYKQRMFNDFALKVFMAKDSAEVRKLLEAEVYKHKDDIERIVVALQKLYAIEKANGSLYKDTITVEKQDEEINYEYVNFNLDY